MQSIADVNQKKLMLYSISNDKSYDDNSHTIVRIINYEEFTYDNEKNELFVKNGDFSYTFKNVSNFCRVYVTIEFSVPNDDKGLTKIIEDTMIQKFGVS